MIAYRGDRQNDEKDFQQRILKLDIRKRYYDDSENCIDKADAIYDNLRATRVAIEQWQEKKI